jgi:prophage DNA circulation protein
MSLSNLSGGTRTLGNSVSGLSNATNRVFSDLGVGSGQKAAYWIDQLRPASFRGVGFGVLESQMRFGRKISIHQYPYRDTVWVEDLGRSARRYSFSGFLVGADCIAQREKLLKACEEAAAIEGGELVHPTLGRIKVSLAEEVTCTERWDRGRMFEIGFSFIEQGERKFPSSDLSTKDAVGAAADAAKSASTKSFLQGAAESIKSGVATALKATSLVQGWAAKAQGLVNDATNLHHYVQSLRGDFGRLFGHGTVRSSGAATPVQAMLAQGAVARTKVAVASTAVAQSGVALQRAAGPAVSEPVATASMTSFAQAVHALPAAMAAVAPTPADGLRLLAQLRRAATVPAPTAGIVPQPYPAAAPTAVQALQLIEVSTSSLLRRACAIAQVQLAAQYQPSSREDAQSVQALVLADLDEEIVVAGDRGEDESFNTLRTLRSAMVQDMAARSESLAAIVTVQLAGPLPAPAIAQRIYRDAGRSDELITAADPVHPAFMPRNFSALAR